MYIELLIASSAHVACGIGILDFTIWDVIVRLNQTKDLFWLSWVEKYDNTNWQNQTLILPFQCEWLPVAYCLTLESAPLLRLGLWSIVSQCFHYRCFHRMLPLTWIVLQRFQILMSSQTNLSYWQMVYSYFIQYIFSTYQDTVGLLRPSGATVKFKANVPYLRIYCVCET